MIELIHRFYQAGTHSMLLNTGKNGIQLASGLYLIRLESPDLVAQCKAVLLK